MKTLHEFLMNLGAFEFIMLIYVLPTAAMLWLSAKVLWAFSRVLAHRTTARVLIVYGKPGRGTTTHIKNL